MFVASLAVLLATAAAIPATTPGRRWAWGNPASPTTIEIFVDLQCHYSAAGWPSFNNAISRFNTSNYYLIPHTYIIPKHRQSWDLAMTVDVIARHNPRSTRDAVTAIFATNDQWNNPAWAPQTRLALHAALRTFAGRFGVPANVFDAEFDKSQANVMADWQYCNRRGMTRAPVWMINGVQVPDVESTTTEAQWVELLAKYIQ